MGAQEDRELLDGLAERLGLEDDERDNFVNSSMKRMGYKPRTDWDEPEPEENRNNDGGDFFSRRKDKQQRQSRDVSGGRQRPSDRDRRTGGGYDY